MPISHKKAPKRRPGHRASTEVVYSLPSAGLEPPECPPGLLVSTQRAWAAFWSSDVSRAVARKSDMGRLTRWISQVDEYDKASRRTTYVSPYGATDHTAGWLRLPACHLPPSPPMVAGAIEREGAEERVGRGLILEHVIPVNLVVAQMEAATKPGQVIEALRRDLILAIITKEQNAALNAAGLGKTHPDPSRPWLRYAKAEITVTPFPSP
jgi:hypothetical protein